MLTTLLSIYTLSALSGNQVNLSPVLIPQKTSSAISVNLPEQNYQNIAPIIKAKSAIAVDLQTGLILYEKNSRERLPIASLTKLMTSVIILENHKLDEIMSVSKTASEIEGSKIWLVPNEKMTVGNLLSASLINSANDAAYVLAENDSPKLQDFLAKMNQKAKELGLKDSNFTNPVGLDEKGNYSNAYDLTILGIYAYDKSFIQKTASTKELEISSIDGKSKHTLKTTNDLLSSYLKVTGLKTGTTDLAGQCLIAIIENNQGHAILTVVLGSTSRYQETKVLSDWVFRTYTWK